MKNIILRYKFITWLLRLLNPGYSYCEHCKLPWNYCSNHVVWMEKGISWRKGTFALCDYCWSVISLELAIYYHTLVYHEQEKCSKGKMDHNIKDVVKYVTEEYIKTH